MTSATELSKRQIVTTLFNAQKSDAEIAAALRESGFQYVERSIYRLRRKYDLIRPRQGRPMIHTHDGTVMDTEFVEREFAERNPKTREEIARVIEGIAAEVNRDPDHVRRYLRDAGIVSRQHEEIPAEKVKRAEALLREGLPYTRVAREVGLSTWQLARRFPGRGLRSGVEVSEYRQALKLEQKLGLTS